MDTLDLSFFRLLHIVAGVGWVGVGFAMSFLLHPIAKRLGTRGQRFLGDFYDKSRIGMWMAIFSVVTVVAGLYVYGRLMAITPGGFWLSMTGFWVLTIGAGFGLLAFGHGAAVMNKASKKMIESASAVSDTPTDEQQSALDEAQKYLYLHMNISFGLAVVALVLMSGARYL